MGSPDMRAWASDETSASSAATSHIYTGPITTFTGSTSGTSGTSSTNPGQYNPNQTGASGMPATPFKAVPQYLVMPTNGSRGKTADDFTGPAGYGPAQIAGAYGLNLVMFGAIKGDGAGQTIAVVDAGE